MPIRSLTAIDSLQSGDNIAVGSLSNGDDRRAALSVLLEYLQDNLTITDASAMVEYATQYAAPSASGQTIQVTDSSSNTHLIVTPVAGYAAMTITFPALANLADKQDLLINCTQNVTTLTLDGNGATIVGGPTAITANDFFRFKYDENGSTWYRVG